MSIESRRRIFRHFAETARPPALAPQEAAALAAEHAVVLDEAGAVAFANPFAAGPADYRVTTSVRTYSAVCVWDALGVAAALAQNATIDTRCPDCGDDLRLTVDNGKLDPSAYVVHFLVPAMNWYDDLGFT
ncbi:MAG: organomercurial lyase [Solirubrobacteraceae bacterium]